MNYPFRFDGVNIGDKVFWVCWEGLTNNQKQVIVETTITHKSDSFDFAPRDTNDPKQAKENWCIFYYIEHFDDHGLRFGDDLFLTKEEAEKYVTEN